jgi:hypothetical protein
MSPRSAGSAAKKHVFSGVTLQTIMSLQGQGGDGGTYKLQLDPGNTSGMLTIDAGIGDVVLRFSHDNERAELTLSIVKKPMLVPSGTILSVATQVLRNAASQTGSTVVPTLITG